MLKIVFFAQNMNLAGLVPAKSVLRFLHFCFLAAPRSHMDSSALNNIDYIVGTHSFK